VGGVAVTRESRLVCDATPEELTRHTRQEFLSWFEQYPVSQLLWLLYAQTRA